MAGSTRERGQPTIGLIGLGATGLAVGQALTAVRTNYRLLGHDRDAARVQAALKAGAVDQGTWKLWELAEQADLVILAEPLPTLLETLEQVAPQLPPGSLITDTAPLKAPVMAAAERVVPAGVSFVGGHPLRSRYPRPGAGPLTDATWCLVPRPDAADDAVRVLTSLVEAVGARPFFIDAAEHDALVAGTHYVPELIEAVCLGLLDASPSAPDLRRLAGPTFRAAELDDDPPAERGADLVANAAAVGVWLDQLLVELSAVRLAVAAGNVDDIVERLARSDLARTRLAEAPEDQARAATHAALDDVRSTRGLFFGRRRPPG
jgi:prephenate dehydrogenase